MMSLRTRMGFSESAVSPNSHSNPQALLGVFGQGLPTLLLLDIKLPRKDGFEVLDWIRHHPKLAPLRVIMLTGSPRAEDVNRAYRMGANSYVSKPVSASAFRDILAAIGTHWFQHSKMPDLTQSLPV